MWSLELCDLPYWLFSYQLYFDLSENRGNFCKPLALNGLTVSVKPCWEDWHLLSDYCVPGTVKCFMDTTAFVLNEAQESPLPSRGRAGITA